MAFSLQQLLGLGSGLGGAAGLMGIGKGKNPADVANQYIDQIPGQTFPYYQPYMNAGTSSLNQFMDMLGQNPSDVYNKLGEGYKQSPGYKFALEQALAAQNNASAAGGMLGTPMHQQQSMETAEGLAARDFENYMNHVLGINTENKQGLGQLTGLGYNAASDYASGLANNLGQKASYGFAGQAAQNQKKSNDWANIFGALPFLFG